MVPRCRMNSRCRVVPRRQMISSQISWCLMISRRRMISVRFPGNTTALDAAGCGSCPPGRVPLRVATDLVLVGSITSAPNSVRLASSFGIRNTYAPITELSRSVGGGRVSMKIVLNGRMAVRCADAARVLLHDRCSGMHQVEKCSQGASS